MENDWSADIESVLSQEHKKKYFELKENLKYYKIPVIIIYEQI